jgi:hypothetical protein
MIPIYMGHNGSILRQETVLQRWKDGTCYAAKHIHTPPDHRSDDTRPRNHVSYALAPRAMMKGEAREGQLESTDADW